MLICVSVLWIMMTPTNATAHSTLDQSRKQYGAIMADNYYRLLALCESGTKDPTPWSTYQTKTYTSALGMARGSWRRYAPGSWPSAKNRTNRQIIRVADALAFSGRTLDDGTYRHPVGPFGWGCVRNSPTLKQYICQSHHPKVQRWRGRACRG